MEMDIIKNRTSEGFRVFVNIVAPKYQLKMFMVITYLYYLYSSNQPLQVGGQWSHLVYVQHIHLGLYLASFTNLLHTHALGSIS